MAFFRSCECWPKYKSITFQIVTEKGNVGGKIKRPPSNNYYEAEGLINTLLGVGSIFNVVF